MAKTPLKQDQEPVAAEPEKRVPAFQINFYRVPNTKFWTSEFLKDGVVIPTPRSDYENSYVYNAALMERKMRLAVHE